jgi:hypothetical protein
MHDTMVFMVRNIEKTYEIYNAISEMEEALLSMMDSAIRKAYGDWLGSGWMVSDDWRLHEDSQISVSPEHLLFKKENGERDSSMWVTFELPDDDPIWQLFGLPGDNEGDNIRVKLETNLMHLNERSVHASKEIDEIIRQRGLLNKGFRRKGGKKPYYERSPIMFTKDAVLKGIENDDWEEAFKPLKDSWKILGELPWDRIAKIISGQ